MALTEHRRLIAPVTLYAALALGWIAVSRWIIPPLLLAEHPGRFIAFVKRSVQNVPAPFLTSDLLGCWREFSGAVLIVLILQLSIIVILFRDDSRSTAGRSSADLRTDRRGRIVLLILSLSFLAVAVLYGARQDYYFYLHMWCEVRLGHDPWFIVAGINGLVPLNAYGPLFNLLAWLVWVNPLAPKLLFAYAYILFAIAQTRAFLASRPSGGLRWIVLTALFWNPFPWVEIANRGHFDILVALLCLWAIRQWSRGRDIGAGISLAMGVLLKYLPVVLLPFLARDRAGRFRFRFVEAAVAAIALGMALSCYWWGPTTLSALTFAANRRSTSLSIFRFIRGHYSPLLWFGVGGNYDFLSPIVMSLALMRAWWWSWARRPDVEASAVVAVTTTVLFYQTGFPQYQMLPFVLGSSWALRHWEQFRGRGARVAAIAAYFGWLAAFDFYYSFVVEDSNRLYWFYVQEVVGLPAFLFGWAFLVSMVKSEDEAILQRRESGAGESSGPDLGDQVPP
jgi:Glycosyltransferase family 87